MASTLVSTLYPPLVDTFMPAFINTDPPKVFFSLSPYNTEDKIKRIHVTLVDQTNNQNVLQPDITTETIVKTSDAFQNPVCVDGVLIIPFDRLGKDEELGIYSFDIPLRFLKTIEGQEEKSFKVGQYYKVQIRLDSTPALQYAGKNLTSDYLLENRQYFSEWSSVCLIRPIGELSLYLEGFERAELDPSYPVPFAQGYVHLVGRLQSADELMQSYRFRLKDGEILVTDSGIQYPNTGSNQINYLLSADNAQGGSRYKLLIDIVTKNQYEFSKEYWIQISEYDTEYTFNPNITLSEDIEDGFVKIKVVAKDGVDEVHPPGKMYVKRASSKDNFKTWELLSCTEHTSSGDIDIEIVDNTIGSMIQYKYSAQFWYTGTNTWSSVILSDTIYPTFYDIILSRNNTQLAIRYNGQLTSMKPIVQRAKFDTLGSKYPRFAENAHMNYRQYSLSGLISAEGDFNRRFLSEKSEEYAANMQMYEQAFGASYMVRNDSLPDNADNFLERRHDTYPHENWYWERTFRDEVIAWLNDGEPKLFRSMPEGNMIVMVTDVNLTPNQNIGRMLYNFTATLYEVGDGYSLTALDAAKVIDVPNPTDAYALDIDSMISQVGDYFGVQAGTITTIGQLPLTSYVIDDVQDNLHLRFMNDVGYKNEGVRSSYLLEEDSLSFSNIQIQFTSDPLFYKEVPEDGKIKLHQINTAANETSNLLGYVVIVDGQHIFVNEKGYYSIPSTTPVSNIEIADGTAIVNFIATYDESIVVEKTPDYSFVEQTVIGQLLGLFDFEKWLGESIRVEYKLFVESKGTQVTQEMKLLRGATFELPAYSLVDVLYEGEEEPARIMIGRSGTYHLSTDYGIEDIRVAGRRFILNEEADFKELDPWEYRHAVENEDAGHRNTIYGDVICVNEQEYPFTQESDTSIIVHMPVEGYITYTGDIIQDIYTEVQ